MKALEPFVMVTDGPVFLAASEKLGDGLPIKVCSLSSDNAMELTFVEKFMCYFKDGTPDREREHSVLRIVLTKEAARSLAGVIMDSLTSEGTDAYF